MAQKRAETCRFYNYHSLINISCVKQCRFISYICGILQHNVMGIIKKKFIYKYVNKGELFVRVLNFLEGGEQVLSITLV
jgi:hypothetical protein